MDNKNILFIGGDVRQIFCAQYLYHYGYEVAVYGFDKYENIPPEILVYSNLKIAVVLADIIVLPTPVFINNSFNAPYSGEDIHIEEILLHINAEKTVFAGKLNHRLRIILEERKTSFVDVLLNEELAIKNAYLTAEGALFEMMRHSPEALREKTVLITGFGRISKNLIRLLTPLKVDVCVAARKKADLTWAKLMGCRSKNIVSVHDLNEFDFVINTVPVPVFSEKVYSECKALFLDLAPCGKQYSEQYIKANGVPGKYAPKSAGKNLADFIHNEIGGET